MSAPTLVEFLLARLDEDERLAEAALAWADDGGPWSTHGEFPSRGGDVFDHVARHDPARVLAEVAAKRRIAELHSDDGAGACSTCGTAGEYDVSWPCTTVELLALPHAEHPDYRQEWTP